MVWACTLCTFQNDNDSDTVCSMCETPIPSVTKSSIKSTKTKQQTLFGKPVVESQKHEAKTRKRQRIPKGSEVVDLTLSVKGSGELIDLTLSVDHKFPLYVRTTRPTKEDISLTLKNVFGLQTLRPLQELVVSTVMEKDSQLVVLATGGGKSLCYQLPACLMGGVTLVISPLIALMQDQVLALKKKHIPAACYSSSNTTSENNAILDRLLLRNKYQNKKSSYVLVYITPESIQTSRMQNVLRLLHEQNRLSFFAVDEAHCLSSWGHDFRPAYRKLDWLRTNFTSVPCLACTATATKRVIQDIQTTLQLTILQKGRLDRQNIFYKVKYKDTLTNPMQDLVTLVAQQTKYYKAKKGSASSLSSSSTSLPCGIIYVHKRNDTQMLAQAISKVVPAAAYHGGLAKKERQRVQEGWFTRQIPVVVATVAFGMGIDKSDVRFVIHWNMPKSLEEFSQESGRAGRDGLPSHSILYFSQKDAKLFTFLAHKQHESQEASAIKKNKPLPNRKLLHSKLKALENMEEYCMKPGCRRNSLIRHFGGDGVECDKTCDYCSNPKRIERDIQSTQVAPINDSSRYNDFQLDGQWDGPIIGEDDEDDEDLIAEDWGDGMVGDLKVTDSRGYGTYKNANSIAGFATASSLLKSTTTKTSSINSVLNKYEALERRQQENDQPNGFVKFRPKSTNAKIPDHFRACRPDSLEGFNNKQEVKPSIHTKSSAELQQDLNRIKHEREQRMKALLEKQKDRKGGAKLTSLPLSSTLSAPPPPTFGSRKRHRYI